MDTFSTAPWVDILIFLGMVLALGGALFLARQLFVDTSETVEQTSGTGSPVPAEPAWGESSDFFQPKEELGNTNTGLMGNLKNMFNRDKTPVKPVEEKDPEPLEKEVPRLEVKAKSEDFRREDPFAELQRKVKESTMIAEEYEKPIENKTQVDSSALTHSIAVVEESETVLDTDDSILESEAKAEQEAETKRLAEEAAETARKESEAKVEKEAEAKRLAEEEAETARKESEAKAEQEAETKRLAEEAAETARKESEAKVEKEAEAKRLAEEEAETARKESEAKAEQEAETKRLAEEAAETARKESEAKVEKEAEAKRLAAEAEEAETARKESEAKAEQEAEAKRLAAEAEEAAETARKETEAKAEQEAETKRLAAEAEEAVETARKETEAKAEQEAETKRLAAEAEEAAETARKETEAKAEQEAEQEAETKRLATEAEEAAETTRKESEAKAEQEAEAKRLEEEERRKVEEEEARRLLEAKELTRQREEEEAKRIAEEKAERLQKLEETPKEVVEEPLEKLVKEVLAQGEDDKGDWTDLHRTKKKEDKQGSVSDKLAKLLGIAKPPKIEKFNQPLIRPEEEKLVDAKGSVGESMFVSDQPGRIETSLVTEEQIRRRKPRLIPDEVAILSTDQLRIALVNTGGAMVYLGHDSGTENQLEINMMPPPIPEKGLDGPLFVKGAQLSFSMRGSEVEEKGYQFKIRFQDEVGVEYYQEIAGRGKDIPFITRPVKA